MGRGGEKQAVLVILTNTFCCCSCLLALETGDDGIDEAEEIETDPLEEDEDDSDDETYFMVGLEPVEVAALLNENIFTGRFINSVILFRSPNRLNSSIGVVELADELVVTLNGFFLFINDRK